MPATIGSGGVHSAIREYRMPAKVFHWLTVALIFFMVASGVTATQIGEGPVAETLLNLHRLTGFATLIVVILRLGYRLMHPTPRPPMQPRSRTALHWTLYGVILVVPLLGWAGASDFNHREIPFGYKLPQIFPESSGYGDLIVFLHAYIAFALLALVALHIGAAMHDYMTNATDEGAK
jgi:cytochrome b561